LPDLARVDDLDADLRHVLEHERQQARVLEPLARVTLKRQAQGLWEKKVLSGFFLFERRKFRIYVIIK
jgi:hypothetical protein